jgi:hypothetical protein
MAIKTPNQNVYYYECSNGRFRLSYFIPPGQLKKLSKQGRISPKAVKDFPDGVDIGCIEADFEEFEKYYEYKIPLDPKDLRNAFLAILSSTHKWEQFRGSGFIPAADLEDHIKKVDTALSRAVKTKKKTELPPEELSLKQLHQKWRQKADQQKQMEKVLHQLKVKGVDSKKSIAEQSFTKIKKTKGEDPGAVFFRLHQKQRKEK